MWDLLRQIEKMSMRRNLPMYMVAVVARIRPSATGSSKPYESIRDFAMQWFSTFPRFCDSVSLVAGNASLEWQYHALKEVIIRHMQLLIRSLAPYSGLPLEAGARKPGGHVLHCRTASGSACSTVLSSHAQNGRSSTRYKPPVVDLPTHS